MQGVPERQLESDEVKSDSTNRLLSNATCSYTETQPLVTAAEGQFHLFVRIMSILKLTGSVQEKIYNKQNSSTGM